MTKEQTELVPLWVTGPDYPMGSMVWRMGEGQTVSSEFQRRYKSLSEEARRDFRSRYPEPKAWIGYYDLLQIVIDEES